MNLFDLTFPSPAENLAVDEALLDWCEAGAGEDVLRFWESREYFVVVGYANKIHTEVNIVACEANGVPVYRRCSGGGTVLQGPGCLNYSLILSLAENGPLRTVASANRLIMGKNRAAIEPLLCKSKSQKPKPELAVRGYTDLCLGNLKFSGNSQRRRKRFLLFHGTFLLDFNLALVGQLLVMPSKQPDYRANRMHNKFLTNLNIPAETIKAVLQRSWNAADPLKSPPLKKIAILAREKYSTEHWNQKF